MIYLGQPESHLRRIVNKNIARTIADSLTWSRIFSVAPITLLAWYNLKWWVFGVYTAVVLDADSRLRVAVPAAVRTDLCRGRS